MCYRVGLGFKDLFLGTWVGTKPSISRVAWSLPWLQAEVCFLGLPPGFPAMPLFHSHTFSLTYVHNLNPCRHPFRSRLPDATLTQNVWGTGGEVAATANVDHLAPL